MGETQIFTITEGNSLYVPDLKAIPWSKFGKRDGNSKAWDNGLSLLNINPKPLSQLLEHAEVLAKPK